MPEEPKRFVRRSDPRNGRFEFKRGFLRGLAVLLPSLLTVWILVACYQFVDRNIAEPINGLARTGLAWASTMPGPLAGRFEPNAEEVDAALADRSVRGRVPDRVTVVTQLRTLRVADWWSSRWWTSFFGLIVALAGVYTAGRLVGGWLGRRSFSAFERLLTRIPIFKQIYPSIKQIVGFFFSDGASDERLKFSRVVLVEYPRKGVWSIGLLTGTAMRAIESESGEAMTIFIPSSPTPFTGYTITVPRSEVHELPISIDEALKYLVSGGVVVPPHQESPPRDPLPAKRPALAQH